MKVVNNSKQDASEWMYKEQHYKEV